MRARMAIKRAGLQCELREVMLKQKPDALLQASPKGTVPVLITSDCVIDESLEIMRFALVHGKADDWQLQELSHPLVQYNDGEFKHYLDRYKYFDRYPECSQSEYFAEAVKFLALLDSALIDDERAQPFLVSPQLSTIDLAVFPFVRQFAFVDKAAFDALPYVRLQLWLECLLSAEVFLSVMQKYPQWVEHREPIVF
ncbi:glutathione S-transferase [Arenicella xantha]|uniref:Glutathione S-transferase n=2 Tax=Arenicella xantha TaxID=644221 RepID=A0A395JMI0_9GAMM|nr:glutathione S-transferase [Arenicella xantha]